MEPHLVSIIIQLTRACVVLLENLPDVATRIQEQPELILNCAALSLHTVSYLVFVMYRVLSSSHVHLYSLHNRLYSYIIP